MGFGLDFGFSSDKSKTKTRQEQTGTITQDRQSTKTSSGSRNTQQQQEVFTVDEDTRNIITDLVQRLGASAGAAAGGGDTIQQSRQAATELLGLAGSTEEDTAALIAPILNEARRTGEKELTALGTNVSEQAGSSMNTLAQLATGEARAELESQLAALEANLLLSGRQQEVQNLMQGLQGLGSSQGIESQNIASAVQALQGLSGTRQVTTATGSETTEETQQLNETLEKVIDLLTTGKSKSKSSGFDLGISI